MGRPLKIAKATLLNVTNTTATTNIVTVSQTLANFGIVAGMPFVPGTTTGTNLVAGTTYWILRLVGASTFTVSATEPSANPNNTPVTLTTGTTASVLSVGIVDSGFQNPDSTTQSGGTSTNPGVSYGAVGGNTGIYGKQALCRVAIGIGGDGFITSDATSTNVYGGGTDFANTLSAGSALQIAVANNNGGTDYVNLGFVSSVTGYITEVVTDTEQTGSFVITSGDATNFVADQPIVFDDDIGGLTAGTVYWMLSGANTTHFQVSASLGGSAVAVSDDTVTVNASQDEVVLGANATVSDADGAAWIYADDEAGFILRQKGKTKYLVQGATSGLVAQCFTANVANTALTPNTMNILATYANASTRYVDSLNNYQTEVFPTTVAAGSLVGGTQYVIYSSGTTNWTAVGAPSNMTGVTFTATGAGSGTGTAIAVTANPDVIATFNTAYAANTYGGQPNPIVVISNA
jgi:hypothetical protein